VTADEISQMANSYNTDLHTAIINYRHYHGYINLGKVIELRAVTDEQSKARLQGRLEPNKYLMSMNQDGQDMHFSVEIAPESPETGEAYLYGLAMTDDPDSLGTSELKLFSNDANKTPLLRSDFETIHLFDNPEVADLPNKEKKEGWFTKHFKNKQEEEGMKPEQFKEFMAEFKQGMTDGFTDLSKNYSNSLPIDKQQDNEDDKEAPWKKELSTLQEDNKNLSVKMDELIEKFSTPASVTDSGEDDGDGGEIQGVL
jgi:hypothetical protein